MRRVGYDGQAFLSPNGGTGKGLQLRNLLGPFLHRFTGFASNSPNPSGISLVQEGAARYNVWQQFSLPASLRRHNIDVFLAPYNTAPFFLPSRVELLLVLHDTILLKDFRKTDWKGKLRDRYRRMQIPASVARAKVVVTVSQHARSEILAMFPRANVRVIPCTIDEGWFHPQTLSNREGHLLMVTSSAPHKNALGAIEAYARYVSRAGSQARRLKIVGLSREADSYRSKTASLPVDYVPFVTEAELRELYRNAAALIFPSFAEGFGIPMLEAMATGTPVIAARATSLPEVGGDAAIYFDPGSQEEMTTAMERVLGDEHLQKEMARKGLAKAEEYRPAVIGKQVADFWHEFAGVS
jgi:glycosyltransferase involved in cell wall biosynthesis